MRMRDRRAFRSARSTTRDTPERRPCEASARERVSQGADRGAEEVAAAGRDDEVAVGGDRRRREALAEQRAVASAALPWLAVLADQHVVATRASGVRRAVHPGRGDAFGLVREL